MPERSKTKSYYIPYKCRLCGANLIFDSEIRAYVCPICGIVYDYEMLPSYTQLQHTAPIRDETLIGEVPDEVIERAMELFGEKIAGEIKKLDKEIAEEVLRALEGIVKKKTYRVSWRAIRSAINIARKHGIPVDIEEMRERSVREEIEKIVKKHKLPVNPIDIYLFALKYKNLWSGRKASTIAIVFTYIYCEKYASKTFSINSRYMKLVKMFKKVIFNE